MRRPASPTAPGPTKAATIPPTWPPLFEAIVKTIPPPSGDPQATLQVQVTNLDYNDFLGRIAIARVFQGTLRRGEDVAIAKLDGKLQTTRITKLFTFRGLERDEAETVEAGDIVAVAGVEGIQIGETITDALNPAPLEPLVIDEPTLAMLFTVNTSPLSGRDGQYLTSRDLRDRLAKELLTNVSIRVEDTDTPDAFRVLGRGELQLAILIETMRREGFELMVGKPEIVVRTENGKRVEPLEMLLVDCPETFIGIVMEGLGTRRGELAQMVNHGSGRVRMEFKHPLARPDRPAQPVAHRNARHRAHPFAARRLDRIRRRNGLAADRRAGGRSPRRQHRFCPVECAGTRRAVHRPRRRGLRGHDRRR